MKIYTIIQINHEGIDKLWWSGTDEGEAVAKTREIRDKAKPIVPEFYLSEEYDEMSFEELLEMDEWDFDQNQICLQVFDGERYRCCCAEFGLPPDGPVAY